MLIGITGGIGCGKSTIASQLHNLGYPTYDTDSRAKYIIINNPMVRSQVELLFGSEVLEGDVYHTELVSKQVFHHPDLLTRLNRIVHPAVAFDLQEWERKEITQHPEQPICFVESAIIFESGLNLLCDKVIAITAPEDIRISRTILRDHSDASKVLARIHAQSTDDDIQRADLIINNDGNTPIPTLCQQILNYIKSLSNQ